MFADMHERIGLIATEDSEREEELGGRCPSTIHIILTTGHVIEGRLVDGENSHDLQTIDVVEAEDDVPGGGRVWAIASSTIAAIRQTYPTEKQRATVAKRATA